MSERKNYLIPQHETHAICPHGDAQEDVGLAVQWRLLFALGELFR